MSFKQQEYVNEFQKANYKAVNIRLHKEYDKDIIEHLEKQKNKQGYIKEVLREKIEQG